MTIEVDVQVACGSGESTGDIPPGEDVAAWARAAIDRTRGCCGDTELTVRFVDEAEGARLNETYRGRNGATNVLSFPFEVPAGVDPGALDATLLGDVVVCAPVAAREAGAQGKDRRSHLAHLVVHGTLHLLGFDHEAEPDALEMERTEGEVLEALGFADPYAGERSGR